MLRTAAARQGVVDKYIPQTVCAVSSLQSQSRALQTALQPLSGHSIASAPETVLLHPQDTDLLILAALCLQVFHKLLLVGLQPNDLGLRRGTQQQFKAAKHFQALC